MESGVYDYENLKKMKEMVYEQGDRKIEPSVLYRMIVSQHPNLQGFKFKSLISVKVVKEVFNKY